MENFAYPLEPHWTKEEIIIVVDFLAGIEQAYHQGIPFQKLQTLYKNVLTVIPSKSEQKKLDRAFKKASQLEIYPVIKKLKEGDHSIIKI